MFNDKFRCIALYIAEFFFAVLEHKFHTHTNNIDYIYLKNKKKADAKACFKQPQIALNSVVKDSW